MFRRIYAIALNTFREAVRDRVLYGIVFFAVAILAFAVVLGEVTLGQERRVLFDVGTSAISLFAVLTAIFLGVSLLYKEVEKKTLYVILAKPVRRAEFVAGKYLGMVATGVVQIAIMTAVLSLLLALWGTPRPSDPEAPLVYASVLVLGEYLVVSAIALLFSSFSTPFVGGLLTGLLFLAGRLVSVMNEFADRHPSAELRHLLRGAAQILPNLNLFVPSRTTLVPYIAGYTPELYLAKTTAYGLAYAAVLLLLAILVFQRRDLT